MADYTLSKRATEDFRSIAQYTIDKFGLQQAAQYEAALVRAAKTAAHFPSVGVPYVTRKGRIFQKFNVGRHALFYQVDESGIFIVRVLHLMMDFDRHLEA